MNGRDEIKEVEGLKKRTKSRKFVCLLVLLILLLLAGVFYWTRTNPRVRLLMSVLQFSESTLKSEEYLLHDVDVMKLCREYINGEIQVEGTAGVSHLQKVKSSISMDMKANRSFAQKRMGCEMQVDYLWVKAGELDFYGEGETIYLEAPMLGDNIGYAFPTGMNLFMKAPQLTSDINQKWFRQNAKNIIELMGDISIRETKKTIKTQAGKEAEEFVVTIPQGKGKFIWELLGMESPSYDVVCSLYLTKANQMVQMEVESEHVLAGLSLTLYGEHLGNASIFYPLPDEESVRLLLARNAKKKCLDATLIYETNMKKTYEMTSNLSWTRGEEGITLKVKDMQLTCLDKVLAQGFFKGKITPVKELEDPFWGKEERLYKMEVLDWKQIRQDTQSFINQVLAKTSFGSLVQK